ncbi:hypothetical protein M434DRAFT_114085 [Hypoxylon sp. CO27-5]|nr:hypothetical protein M434DRAFT_114085 [Hypoxylon sp. CO27-5]
MAEEGRGRVWHTKSTTTSSDDASSSTATPGGERASGSECSGFKTGTINVHNPAVSYGGIDPEIEENVLLVKTVPGELPWLDRRKELNCDLDDDINTPEKRSRTSAASRGSWIHASIPQTTATSRSASLAREPRIPSSV